jgi:translocation and assembly module TamB
VRHYACAGLHPAYTPPTTLDLPVRVSAQLLVEQLVWHSGGADGSESKGEGNSGQEWALTPLHARYHYDHRHHQLSVTQLGWQQGHYTAQAQVSALADLTLTASLSGQLPPNTIAAARDGARPALALLADLQGSLRTDAQPLALNAAITARYNTPSSATQAQQTAQVQLAIAPWADWPIVQATGQVQGLNLAPLWPGMPTTALTGQVHLTPSPTQWTAGAQLTNTAAGPWDQGRLPVDRLEATVNGLPTTAWTLQALDVRYAAGRLTASGRWQPGQALWHGDAIATALEPARLDTRLAGPPLSFRAQARHTAQGVTLALDGGSSARPGLPTAQTNIVGKGGKGGNLPGAASRWTVHAARFNGLWSDQRLALHDVHLQINRLQVDGEVTLDWKPLALQGALQLRHPGLQGTVQGRLSALDGAGSVQLTTADPPALHELLSPLEPSWGLTPPALMRRLRGGTTLTGDWRSGWKGSALGPLSTWQLSAAALSLQPPPAVPGSATAGGPLTLSHAQLQWSINPDNRVNVSGAGQWQQGSWSGSARSQMQAQWASDGHLHITWPQWDVSVQSGPQATPWRASLAQAWTMDASRNGPVSELRHDAVQWQLSRGGVASQSHRLPPPAALAPSAPLPLKLSAGRLTADAQSGAWRWTHQGELPHLPLAWLKDLPGLDSALADLQGDLTLAANWQLEASPNALLGQAQIGRLAGDLLVGTELATSTSTSPSSASVGRQQAPIATAVPAGLREFKLTVQAQDRRVNTQVAWASERAGSASGAWSTSLDSEGGWHWSPEAPIQGQLDAHLPQLGLWSKLAPPGWRVRGTLDSDLRLSGTRSHPVWSGTLTARELALRSAVEGVELGNGRLDARFQGDGLVIDRFEMIGPALAGQAPGVLTAQGSASWRAAAAAPSAAAPLQGLARLTIDARATAERLRISSRADRRMVVSGTLSARLAASRWTVRGQLKADSASIQLPDESTPTLGADVIRPGAGTVPPLASPLDANTATPDSASTFGANTVDLALDIDLGPAFQLQGRGLSSTLAGQLRWTLADGPQQPPQPKLQNTTTRLHGDVQVRQGTFKAYGQLLDIARGTVRFAGQVDNPQLDIEAIRPGIAQRVGVAVTGPAQQPKVQLIADADMGDAEKLSWLILGRAASGGNAEAAVLQQAALALLGGSGGGIGGELSRAVGLDELSVSTGGTTGATLTLGKRLARNVYVAYERSLAGSLGTLYLFLDLTRSVTVRAQAGEQSAVDLIWTRRFD